EHVALLGQELGALLVKARRVRAVRLGVEKVRTGSPIAPASAQQHPGALWDPPVLGLPGLQALDGQQEVWVALHIGGDVYHTGGGGGTSGGGGGGGGFLGGSSPPPHGGGRGGGGPVVAPLERMSSNTPCAGAALRGA